jgi:hypothetical protein
MTNEKDYKSIINTLSEAIKNCNTEIPLIRNSISKAQNRWPENKEGYFVSNVPLRLRLAIVDMSILFINILTSPLETSKNLNARLVCTQLYEFLEDVPKMFGKRYRKQFSQLPNPYKIDDQINMMMTSFNDTKLKYLSYLKQVRNNVSSHRDEDGMLQVAIIESIEPLYICSIFLQITKWFYTDFLPYELLMISFSQELGFGSKSSY